MEQDTTGQGSGLPDLLVLAAGMGSRYGGLKQIDPIGPNGETIIDYSVYDARRAGFGRLVFVIRRDIETTFKEHIGARFAQRMPVAYVFQELDKLPPGYGAPPERKKPWGTGQAILVGEEAIQGPFGVINADDFYGADSFRLLAGQLKSRGPEYAMVGFVLRNTLSEFGSVARGICRAGPDGYLESALELTGIEPAGQAAKYTDSAGLTHPLTGDEIVSLNMWGFNPTVFGHLRRELGLFLEDNRASEKAEFYIPAAVNNIIRSGRERVRVLRTPDSWFGVTYREDRFRVQESILQLIRQGQYPERLWD